MNSIINSIEKYLEEKGVTTVGSVVDDPENKGVYLAFIKITLGKNEKEIPSQKTLNNITAHWLKRDVILKLITIDDKLYKFRESLQTLFETRYIDLIEDFSLLKNQEELVLFINIKKVIDSQRENEIAKTLSNFCELHDYRMKSVNFHSTFNPPTRTAILRTLRTIAPANIDNLQSAIKSAGYYYKSEYELQKHLDALRKRGFIIRRQDVQVW